MIRRTLGLIILPVIAVGLFNAFRPPQRQVHTGHIMLSLFALAFLPVDLATFARRRRGQRKDKEAHSGEAGY